MLKSMKGKPMMHNTINKERVKKLDQNLCRFEKIVTTLQFTHP